MTLQALIGTMILGVMCVVMYLLARVAKRRMGIGAGTVGGDALKIVGKRPLDQKSSLYVVQIAGGRHILLGSGVDGTVTKLDDISAEEYEAMVDQDTLAAAKARPKLKLAMPTMPGRSTGPLIGTVGDAGEPDVDPDAIAAAAAHDSIETAAADEEQRFATVGESFQLLLGKAKEARASRKDGRASGE